MGITVDAPVTAVSNKTNDILNNLLKIYYITLQNNEKQLICNPSIIIINELSIVTIFVANLLQFETVLFPNPIV